MRLIIYAFSTISCASIVPEPTDGTPLPPAASVDLVLVVDNLVGSDAFVQDLADAIPDLAERLDQERTDYRIGLLLSHDKEDPSWDSFIPGPPSLYWIDRTSGDLDAILTPHLVVGRSRAATLIREQVFSAVDGPRNQSFRRSDAPLHVVVVSPRDDRSEDRPVSHQDFAAWISSQPEGSAFHAIVGVPPDCPGAAIAERHMWVQERTGGVLTSICEPDFDAVWEAVVPPASD
ncbi:MAG: hypothetical protein AB8H79_02680 [Myxococcota bacterium]